MIELAQIRRRAQEGLLRVRARTDEPVEGPIGGEAAAVTVATFDKGYRGAAPLLHRASRVGEWHTKKGTRVRFCGKIEVVSRSPATAADVPHKRLNLPRSLGSEIGRYLVAERAVEERSWVHVLCRCQNDDDGIALSPLVEGSPILLLLEEPADVARQIVNPTGTQMHARVDLATLSDVLKRHEKESFIKPRIAAQ